MTTQWSSSDQARQLSCLIANGAVQVQRNLDIQPTVREGLPCQPDNEVRHLTFTDEFDRLEAIRWLRASKATILSADRATGQISFVWGDKVKAPMTHTVDSASNLMMAMTIYLILLAMAMGLGAGSLGEGK